MQSRIRSELGFSCSVVLSGEEVVPRFRVIAPEGETVIFLPLPEDTRERMRRVLLVRDYMAWRMASAFIVSSETIDPDAVMAVAVTRSGCAGLMRPIVRQPLSLGSLRELTASEIDDGFAQILPREMIVTLDAETIAELKRTFGTGGEFEARPV